MNDGLTRLLGGIGCKSAPRLLRLHISGVACGVMLLGLSACGIADHYLAQNRVEKSQDAYRKCLVENTTNPTRCEALRQFYEQDRTAYLGR